MKFTFLDKTDKELDLIISILKDESISYRIQRDEYTNVSFSPFGICYTSTSSNTSNVVVDTTLEKFDYLNFVFEKKLKSVKKSEKKVEKLERCFNLKSTKKKLVRKETQILQMR